tara:strand:- start:35 stop:292 length:258 start_codon:yes stop_codon:yes gene_type:complete
MDIADCTPVKRSKIVFQSYEKKTTLCDKISNVLLMFTPNGSPSPDDEKDYTTVNVKNQIKEQGIQCNIDETAESWGQYIYIDKKN